MTGYFPPETMGTIREAGSPCSMFNGASDGRTWPLPNPERTNTNLTITELRMNELLKSTLQNSISISDLEFDWYTCLVSRIENDINLLLNHKLLKVEAWNLVRRLAMLASAWSGWSWPVHLSCLQDWNCNNLAHKLLTVQIWNSVWRTFAWI